MLLSEKFKPDDSSIRTKSGSSESLEMIQDYEIEIPYKQFYLEDELIKLKKFNAM